MGSANPDEELSLHVQTFEALSAEDQAICISFLPVREEFSSYLPSLDIRESQESSDTSSDGCTSSQGASDSSASSSRSSVDLQPVDFFTADIPGNSIETDIERQSQATNEDDDCNVFYRQGLSYEVASQLSADYAEYQRLANSFGLPRDMRTHPSVLIAAHALANVETSAWQSESAPEPASSGDDVQSEPYAATSKTELAVDQAPSTIVPTVSQTADTYHSECAIDSLAIENERHTATSAAQLNVDQPPTSLPLASEVDDVAVEYHSECTNNSVGSAFYIQTQPHVASSTVQPNVDQPHRTISSLGSNTTDADTAYHSESVDDWIMSSTFVQNELYAAAPPFEPHVDQAHTSSPPLGLENVDGAAVFNSQSAIDSVSSGYDVQTGADSATFAVHAHIDQASTATLSSAPETIIAAFPSVSSFNPVASGYYDQTALLAHQNATSNVHYTASHASSNPLYSQAAIPRSQVSHSFNVSWDNTSTGNFQQYDVTGMVPQGSGPMQMLYPSMDIATGAGGPGVQQQIGQSVGWQPQYPLYASSSAVHVSTTDQSQSAIVDSSLTQNGAPASASTVSTFHSRGIHTPVPCPVSQFAPATRNSHRTQLQRSNTMPYSQYASAGVFPPHWSFSQAHTTSSSFMTRYPSTFSSRELLPDNDTNVPHISGAVRTKDGKKGKGKAKATKPYTPKPTTPPRRTQSETSATRFHQWDPSQLRRKHSCTPESDASGSSSSSSGRRGKTMPNPVKCLWQGCEGPSFTDRDALRNHIHTHTGPSGKDYINCEWGKCKKDPMQRDSVVRHILTGHARRGGFACDLCDVSCSRSDAEARHRKNICKVCVVCRLQFKTVADRVAHEQQCG